jgi:hypothetical protein
VSEVVLKVGDFVLIRGRGERLGRVERVEEGVVPGPDPDGTPALGDAYIPAAA